LWQVAVGCVLWVVVCGCFGLLLQVGVVSQAGLAGAWCGLGDAKVVCPIVVFQVGFEFHIGRTIHDRF